MTQRFLPTIKWIIALTFVFSLGLTVGRFWPQPTIQAQAQAQAGQGVVITSVIPASPAAQAGVVRGDILLKINKQPLTPQFDLSRYLTTQLAVGDQIQLELQHGDDPRTVTVTLADNAGRPFLGIISAANQEIPRIMTRPGRLEPAILGIEPDSPAARAGLQAGDKVVAVEGTQLSSAVSLAALIDAHHPGERLTLTLRNSDGSKREVEVTLGSQSYLGVYIPPSPHISQSKIEAIMPGELH